MKCFNSHSVRSLLVVLLLVACDTAWAADNQLTAVERGTGWQLLFDGKTFDGWMTSDGKPSRRPIEHSAINPHRAGAYMMLHKQTWTDFHLKLDFKIAPGCNSGVFFRTWTLKKLGGQASSRHQVRTGWLASALRASSRARWQKARRPAILR